MLAVAACASSSPPPVEIPAAQAALCAPGVSLGKVVVGPLTRWRVDQKEPELREAIAMKAIEAVLPAMPCAASVEVLPALPDAQAIAHLSQARRNGATTAILVRIDELGPLAVVSFPTLWSTWSDVKFTLDAVDVASGETLRSIPHRRQQGGAYEVRGLGPLQSEMELALKDVVLGVPAS
jgi:hypothetical protein